MAEWAWRLSLPPAGANHATQVGANGRPYRTEVSKAWERGVRLVVGNWQPPARTPLGVALRFALPVKSLHRYDVDGLIKPVVDAVVGSRADQWVEQVTANKEPSLTEPGVSVRVWTLPAARPTGRPEGDGEGGEG